MVAGGPGVDARVEVGSNGPHVHQVPCQLAGTGVKLAVSFRTTVPLGCREKHNNTKLKKNL